MSTVTVKQRKDRPGKFEVEYYINGKRKRPLFQSKLEADNFARRLRLGLSDERDHSITNAQAAREYYDAISVKKSRASQLSDRRNLNLQEHFLFTHRNVERIGSVQLQDLEAFRDWLLLQTSYDNRPMNMGPATVNRCIRMLKGFYNKHAEWKNIKESPARYLTQLRAIPNDRRPMTDEEFRKLSAKAKDWFKPTLQFMYLTGAPGSTVERLQFSDLDFNQRSFELLRGKGKWKKTRLPMTDELFFLFMVQRNKFGGVGSVFRGKKGEGLKAQRISKLGTDLIRKCELGDVVLYGLRHAMASDMTKAGISLEIVRQTLGHSDIRTTSNYAKHLGLSIVADAMKTTRGGRLVANGDK